MLFWDKENRIVDCKAEITDTTKCEEKALKLLKMSSTSVSESFDMIHVNYGKYEKRSFSVSFDGNEVKVEYTYPDSTQCEYSRGRVTTGKTVFRTPYTLAFVAGLFDFSHHSCLDDVQKYFMRVISSPRYSNDLNKLLGDLNVEQLKLVMDVLSLEKNSDATKAFLQLCSPDIAEFYNILEYIELYTVNTCSASYVKEAELEIAKSNTEITRALRLPFRGRK